MIRSISKSLRNFSAVQQKNLCWLEKDLCLLKYIFTVCSQFDQVLRFQHVFETERLTAKGKYLPMISYAILTVTQL